MIENIELSRPDVRKLSFNNHTSTTQLSESSNVNVLSSPTDLTNRSTSVRSLNSSAVDDRSNLLKSRSRRDLDKPPPVLQFSARKEATIHSTMSTNNTEIESPPVKSLSSEQIVAKPVNNNHYDLPALPPRPSHKPHAKISHSDSSKS
eukprot:TRINITY_DN881_c0_g1_i3.p1 TRINITY_DN881_c0_g1~~TRINITY_DN881_c0_g1_i3.p1  ORF type:complete len:148 (-),score=10.55 TRINITY_DN881_c0_g1_i3:204-647(-)